MVNLVALFWTLQTAIPLGILVYFVEAVVHTSQLIGNGRSVPRAMRMLAYTRTLTAILASISEGTLLAAVLAPNACHVGMTVSVFVYGLVKATNYLFL